MTKLEQNKVVALLGRPLSVSEKANFDLYIDIAKTKLEDLLCRELDEFDELPNDLALVWARFFANVTNEAAAQSGVSSKRVEDFSVSYRENYNPTAELLRISAATIAKYKKCAGGIRHGKTLPVNSAGVGLDDRF